MFVLGRKAGRDPNANAEHLRKRLLERIMS